MKKAPRKYSAVFNKKLIIFSLVAMAMVTTANAQLPGFDDNVDDETPAAPIDGFIAISLIIGSCFGIKKLRK